MDRPALPPAVCLIAGVAVGWSLPGLPALAGILAAGAAAAPVLAACAFRRGAARTTAAVCLAGVAAAGAFAGHRARAALRTPLLAWIDARPDRPDDAVAWIEGRLRRDAALTDYGASLLIDVAAVTGGRVRHPVRGAVRLAVGGSFVDARVDAWRQGRLVRVPARLRRPPRYANPGLPDRAHHLRRRGIDLLGSVSSALLVEVTASGSRTAEWGGRVRAAVRQAVASTVGRHDAQSAAIVTAVLIGDRTGLDPATTDRLQAGGIYHVIAISGGNIAVLAAALVLAVRIAGAGGRLAALIAIGGLLAYAQVAVAEASVARAVFAAVVFLAARAADHRTDPINTLALAAAGLVSVDPRALFDPGAHLTFAATAGILLGVPRMMARAARRPAAGIARRLLVPAAGLLAATLCADLALLPLGALHFSRVTAAGLVLNLAAMPLMTITQLAGLAAVGLAAVPPAAAAAGAVAHAAAGGIVASADLMTWAPWLAWRLPPPPPAAVGVYYAGWAVWLAAAPGSRGRRAVAAAIGAAAVVILAGPFPAWPAARGGDPCAALPGAAGAGPRPSPLRVHLLDVDQADATLVRFPDRRSLLVDAAGRPAQADGVRDRFDVGEAIVVPAVWALGVRRLDYLAITHADADHIGGAGAVLRDLRPRTVWTGIAVPSSQALAALRAGADVRGAAWRPLRAGDLGSFGGARLRVIHPPPPEWERPRVRNDDSLVLEIRYGRVAVILPGDIGADVERTLTDAWAPAGRRVVKAPHHGSRTSSSEAFVAALRPTVAVVSAGRANRFGHPHPTVVRRYAAAGAVVLDTGVDGAAAVCTDGRRLAVTTASGRRLAWSGTAP